MPLKKFLIERDMPKVGSLEREDLRAAAAVLKFVRRKLS